MKAMDHDVESIFIKAVENKPFQHPLATFEQRSVYGQMHSFLCNDGVKRGSDEYSSDFNRGQKWYR